MEGEEPDSGCFDVDTHHPRNVGIVADKHDALSKFVPVQDEPEQHGQSQRPECLERYDAKQPANKELVDEVLLASLECHLQPACQQNRDAVPEEIRRESRHDRWHTDACNHEAVDISHQSAGSEGQHEADPGTVGRIKRFPGPGKGKARKRNNGGETQVDLARGDHQRQPQRGNERRWNRFQEGDINQRVGEDTGCRNDQREVQRDQHHGDGETLQPTQKSEE